MNTLTKYDKTNRAEAEAYLEKLKLGVLAHIDAGGEATVIEVLGPQSSLCTVTMTEVGT